MIQVLELAPVRDCGRFPQPIRITITVEGFAKASGGHRTSFAPETIATRCNKHDQTGSNLEENQRPQFLSRRS
jgi:hypothetical protein